MPTRSFLARIIAVMGIGSMLWSCGGDPEAPAPETPDGGVQITVEMDDDAPQSIGGTGFRVRLTGVDGSINDQEIEWPGGAGAPIPLPAGIYRAEIWTVYFSDAIECQMNPAAPGGQRCTRDETIDRQCGVEVPVQSAIVVVTYRTGAEDWECTLGGPAPT